MNDKPTEITPEDIDKFCECLKNYEMKPKQCFKCGKEYYHSYGEHICECDECYFSRFKKEDVERFYRSFFE